jgi:hypothetical protein
MAAVEGFDPAKSGQQPTDGGGNPIPVGVWGDSTVGMGVFGSSGLLAPGDPDVVSDPAGVEGHGRKVPGVLGRSIEDAGVTGESLQSSGVLGRSQGGSGVLGVTFAAPGGGNGVFGSSTTGGDGVVGFVGDGTGVIGNSVRGDGVLGISGTANGVIGENFSGPGDPMNPRPAGVVGRSTLGDGVSGASTAGTGVFGLNDGAQSGVWGANLSNDAGVGVKGTSLAGTGVLASSILGAGTSASSISGNGVEGFSSRAAGVLGECTTAVGFAGLFNGRVRITGTLSKAGGGFQIDHPLEPENRYLSHSFVESPDMLNVYSGMVTTDDAGEATVTLPDYFGALNKECRYQLTAVGQFAQAMVAREVDQNQFVIATDKPRVTVSWQVTATRNDPWAVANRIEVDAEKTAAERGLYLHPEVINRPESARLRGPATRRDPGARVVDGELARLRATLPAELGERLERTLEAGLRGGTVDQDALRALITECLSDAAVPAPRRRSTRADLERGWAQVQEGIATIGLQRPWPGDATAADTA